MQQGGGKISRSRSNYDWDSDWYKLVIIWLDTSLMDKWWTFIVIEWFDSIWYNDILTVLLQVIDVIDIDINIIIDVFIRYDKA